MGTFREAVLFGNQPVCRPRAAASIGGRAARWALCVLVAAGAACDKSATPTGVDLTTSPMDLASVDLPGAAQAPVTGEVITLDTGGGLNGIVAHLESRSASATSGGGGFLRIPTVPGDCGTTPLVVLDNDAQTPSRIVPTRIL